MIFNINGIGVNSIALQKCIDDLQCQSETYMNFILTPAGTIDFFDIGHPVPPNYERYTDNSD